MKNFALTVLLLTFCALPATAQWTLDNDGSRISFVSTKAGAAAEVHHFQTLDGGVGADGHATLHIQLESVDTAIEIRDERMREMLFETDRHPTATLTTRVDMDIVDGLAAGASANVVAEGELTLHGITATVSIDMTVARLSASRILAVSRKPLIVNASQVGLLDGIERLREVAGLPSISPAVPVTFVLAFDSAG